MLNAQFMQEAMAAHENRHHGVKVPVAIPAECLADVKALYDNLVRQRVIDEHNNIRGGTLAIGLPTGTADATMQRRVDAAMDDTLDLEGVTQAITANLTFGEFIVQFLIDAGIRLDEGGPVRVELTPPASVNVRVYTERDPALTEAEKRLLDGNR